MRAKLGEGRRIRVIDKLLTPLEIKNYSGSLGVIVDSAAEIGLDGGPVDYLVKLDNYEQPVRFYPESLVAGKK